MLGEAKQVISLVECMKSKYFQDLFARRLIRKSYGRRISLLVNADVNFAIDFMFVFQPFFVNKKFSKIPEKTYL